MHPLRYPTSVHSPLHPGSNRPCCISQEVLTLPLGIIRFTAVECIVHLFSGPMRSGRLNWKLWWVLVNYTGTPIYSYLSFCLLDRRLISIHISIFAWPLHAAFTILTHRIIRWVAFWPLTKMDQFWPEHLAEHYNYPAMRKMESIKRSELNWWRETIELKKIHFLSAFGCFAFGIAAVLYFVYIGIYIYTNYMYMLLQSVAACYIYLYEI